MKAEKYIIDNWGYNWLKIQWDSRDVIDALNEFAEIVLKERQEGIISETMKNDEKLGLYENDN